MSSKRFQLINGIYFWQGDRLFKLQVPVSREWFRFCNVEHLDRHGYPIRLDKVIEKTEIEMQGYMDSGFIKYHGFTRPRI